MAEGFEPYHNHVPQQSRRDKLRVVAQNHPSCVVEVESTTSSPTVGLSGCCSALLPLYDPSLLSSDLLTSGGHDFHHHHINNALSSAPAASGKNSISPNICVVKEEGVNFMGFQHSAYLDPQSSLSLPSLNPSSIQEMNNININPFFYTPQNLIRDFDDQSSYNNNNNNNGGQGLSLSLSSHQSHNNTHQNNNLPLELNLQRYDEESAADMYSTDHKVTACGYVVSTSDNDVSRISSVPLGPFTGYALILKGSRFLRPAQHLLEEISDVAAGSSGIINYAHKMSPDYSLMEPPLTQNLSATGIIDDPLGGGDGGHEIRRNKSRLISMLDEVYRRYKQYYQQMQAVVASFECVSGLGNAAPYANLALKTMSKHFRCLKNAITDQLQFTDKAHGQISPGKDEGQRFVSMDRNLYNRPLHNSGFLEHHQPVWRPQRGLPERAVTVLRAWLFEHFLHPYPTDTDKLTLAKQTGLSRSQVSNWFINARVRLWKPMVEEIHVLETRKAQKALQKEGRINANKSSDHLCSPNSLASDQNPSTSGQRFQDTASNKRTRSELPDIPLGMESEPLNLSSSIHPHNNVGVGISMAGGGGSGGVSLTLGLHQNNNNGISLSDRFPINTAQRFGLGLEVSGEGYDIGGFEAQNRHFGRDVMGGQLLHDFVG